jgi:hypothetical protein
MHELDLQILEEALDVLKCYSGEVVSEAIENLNIVIEQSDNL